MYVHMERLSVDTKNQKRVHEKAKGFKGEGC